MAVHGGPHWKVWYICAVFERRIAGLAGLRTDCLCCTVHNRFLIELNSSLSSLRRGERISSAGYPYCWYVYRGA